MYTHIVLLKLSGLDADFHSQTEALISELKQQLPFVRSYAFVRNEARRSSGYDWAILSSFDTAADHERYQASRMHQRIQAFMERYIDGLIVCDAATAPAP